MTIEQTSSADEDYVMQLKAQEQVKKKMSVILKGNKRTTSSRCSFTFTPQIPYLEYTFTVYSFYLKHLQLIAVRLQKLFLYHQNNVKILGA